jgi:predicted NACHT family NTPase
MAKRSLKAGSAGIAKAKRAFERREWTQEYLASAVGLQTRQSVWKFFSGRPIERHLFIDICFQLDLDWQEIADLPNWETPEANSIAQEDSAESDAVLNDLKLAESQDWQWLQEKLRDRTQQHCGTLLNPFNGEKSLPLGQIYTERSLLSSLDCYRWIEATALQQLHNSHLPPDAQRLSPLRATELLPVSTQGRQQGIYDLLTTSPHLLIYGKPGSGKTTLLQFLALQHVSPQAPLARVPLFIPLRQIAPQLNHLSRQGLATLLLQQYPDTGITLPAFQQILSEGKILLLLDGLDELSQDARDRLNLAVDAFVETYPHTSIVITCRLGVPDVYYRGFMVVELADLSDRQIQSFVQKWFATLDADHQDNGQNAAQRFLEQLSQPHNCRLHDLAKTPLLLHMLCWVFREQQQFPKQRSRIYQNILELLLGRWDRLRNLERQTAAVSLNLADYMVLLSQIAGLRFESGQYFFEKKDILAVIFDYLTQLPEIPSTCEALWLESETLLRTLTVNTGLLIERAHEIYSFSHLALQEYLTARRIFAQTHTKTSLSNVDSNSPRYPELLPSLVQKLHRSCWKTQHPFYHLASHVFNSRWHEVILLTIDLLPNSELLLELLKQQIDRSVLSDVNLRSFLQWLDRKAAEVADSSHSIGALRAFYCGLKQGFGLDLATQLDQRLVTEMPPMLALEAKLIQLLQEIDQFLLTPAPQQAQRIFTLLNRKDVSMLESPVCSVFNQARDVFHAIEQQPKPLETWCQTEGTFWAQQLKNLLLQTYDLGYEQTLTPEQHRQIESYYRANVFLANCLCRANPISSEFRKTFAATMLATRERRPTAPQVLSISRSFGCAANHS